MQQIGLIPSGVQLWSKKVILVAAGKLIYCSTIAVYVLCLKDYSVERILTGHGQTITGMCKSSHFPNIIATSSLDQTIRVWDIDTGKELTSISTAGGTHGFKPWCLDWSPYEPFEIACAGGKGAIRIYNYARNDGAYQSILVKSDVDITSIGYNPKNPNVLFAVLRDGHFCLVDLVKQSAFMKVKQSEESKIIDCRWDPMSTHYILVGSDNGELCLYDSEATGSEAKQVRRFDKISGGLASISWIDNEPGNFIVGDSRTGLLRFFNISQQTPLKVLKVRKVGILELIHIPKLEKVLLSFRDGSVGVYDLKQKTMEYITPGSHTETIFDCAFNELDPNIFATSSFDSSIKVWNIKKMQCIDTIVGDKAVIYSLAWHPHKNVIAGGFSNGAVWIWDVTKRIIIHKIQAHRGSCFKISWNKMDPSFFAVSSKDMGVSVINDSGRVVRMLRHPSVAFGIDWSPHDKNVFATGCHDSIVRIFNFEIADTPIRKLRGHTAEVFNVAFHPRFPNIILSGSNDKSVRVWNTETNDCQMLIGHTDFVRALSWNPEIPYLAVSGGWDGTVRVWDARSGRCLSIANDHHADVYGISTHPKRPFIYGSTSRDTTIRFWSLEPLIERLILKVVIYKDLSKCLNPSPSFVFGSTSDDLMFCGRYSGELQNKIKDLRSDVNRYEALFDFFSFPNDSKEIWSVVRSSVSQIPQKKGKVLHKSNIISYLNSKARELECTKLKTTGIGVARKVDILKEAATLYLKQGNVRQYCELMVEIEQWDRALAVAPAVSLDYWRDLSVKYGQKLAEIGSSDCIPHYLATGETDKLMNFFISRNQLDDATIIAQTKSEGGYTPILAAINAKETLVNKPRKIDDPSELKSITEMRAYRYFQLCSPILAAACYAAIDDADRTVRALINGNEIVLAYAVSICMNSTLHNDALYSLMANLCEQHGLTECVLEFLQQIRNKDVVSALVSKIATGNDQEAEKLFVRAGLQSPLFYATEARNINSEDAIKAVRYHALGGDHDQAASVCLNYMKMVFSKETWEWEAIRSISLSMNCIDATKLPDATRKDILAYSSFIGGQEALWKGYYTVAPFLFQNSRSLTRHNDTSFSISTLYLDYMVCLSLSFYDRNEAKHLVEQLISNLDLTDNQTNKSMRSALEHLKDRLNITLEPPQRRRNMIVPTASNLPLRSINGIRTKSFITKREAQAPLFLLNDYDFSTDLRAPTDKTKFYASMSEVIMWNQVNPFSPLNDGRKLRL